MYILDSDIMTFVLKYPQTYPHLLERIKQTPYEHIWVSVISIEEVINGAFQLRNQGHNPAACYRILTWMMAEYGKYQILSYDAEAIRIFDGFPPEVRRGVGNYDRRIAATGLRHTYTVITHNMRDFRLTGVLCEDWTLAPNGRSG